MSEAVTKQPYVNVDDPTLLLIKGNINSRDDSKDYVKKLSLAVFSVFQKHNVARLRCVGAAALNNAVKAIAVSRGEFVKKNSDIAVVPSFQTVNFDGVNEKTAISLEVVKNTFVKPEIPPKTENLLLIRGNVENREEAKDYIKKVSLANFSVLTKYGLANLRCVGAAALNNAVKAIAISKGEFAKKGINIGFVPSFQTVSFDQAGEKTALVLEVIKSN